MWNRSLNWTSFHGLCVVLSWNVCGTLPLCCLYIYGSVFKHMQWLCLSGFVVYFHSNNSCYLLHCRCPTQVSAKCGWSFPPPWQASASLCLWLCLLVLNTWHVPLCSDKQSFSRYKSHLQAGRQLSQTWYKTWVNKCDSKSIIFHLSMPCKCVQYNWTKYFKKMIVFKFYYRYIVSSFNSTTRSVTGTPLLFLEISTPVSAVNINVF